MSTFRPCSRPGYPLATTNWPMEPPDPPLPRVWEMGPNSSTMRSCSIIRDSADVTVLQLEPSTDSEDVATAYPCDSARLSSMPSLGSPWLYWVPQDGPNL